MEKNYNYNYENRAQNKSSVSFSNLELASCKANSLKKQPVSDGMLWHTTDTNKFYFDWNGKRTELNMTGSSSDINSEIAKIKADIAKLDPNAVQQKVNQLENKVNKAVNTVNDLKGSVDDAVAEAQSAAETAQSAAAQVSSKADKEWVESKGYLTEHQSLEDYAKKTDIPSLDGLASEDWVEGKGYLTEHQSLDDYAKKTDVPSLDGLASEDWVEGKGYLTEHQSLEDYVKKADVPVIPDKVSAFTNDAGYLTENDLPDYLTDSDLDEYAPGVFPDAESADSATATADGYAKVQDVMDYVNALIEKKKDELGPSDPSVPFAYISGYALDGTPTDITVFNPFQLNEEGDTEIEVYAPEEITTYSPSTYEDLPSVKFTVDIPEGYAIKEAYIWNDELGAEGEYEIMDGVRVFAQNPRYSSRTIGGVTYNSYSRGPVDDTAASPANEKYKIIITKQ